MNLKNIIAGILVIGVIVIVILLIGKFSNAKPKENINIYFFNVGKADSTLIYNDNFAVLIDTGEKETAPVILKYLNDHQIIKLDYLIITHFDKDHVGGASRIINQVEVNSIITSNYKKNSDEYNDYIKAINDKHIIPLIMKDDYKFSYGRAAFTVNFPKEKEYAKKASNNSSLIVSLMFGNTKYLFMGDAMELRIAEYLKINSTEYDLIKIPYHGKELENSENYISTYKPKYAIITSSKEEEKDNKKLIKILDKYDTKSYLTYNGAILVTTNGVNIRVKQ